MVYTIAKRYEIAASHQLAGLPAGHPCASLHGHNYGIEVAVSGPIDEVRMVVDYRLLDAAIGAWLKGNLDHRHLNDVLHQPTAEALAQLVYLEAARLVQLEVGSSRRVEYVRVSETPATYAEYRP